MTARKYDYAELERRYVEGGDDVSYRSLAKEVGASNNTITQYGKSHGWEDKRERFRAETEERYLQIRAEKRARKLATLAERGVDVLEAMLIQAANRMLNNTLEISGKDALDAIKMIQLLRGDPTERTEGRQVHAHIVDARALDALEALARGKLESEPAGADQPRLLTG